MQYIELTDEECIRLGIDAVASNLPIPAVISQRLRQLDLLEHITGDRYEPLGTE